jgi:hypothetical protein
MDIKRWVRQVTVAFRDLPTTQGPFDSKGAAEGRAQGLERLQKRQELLCARTATRCSIPGHGLPKDSVIGQ